MLGRYQEHPEFDFDPDGWTGALARELEEMCLDVADESFLEFLSELDREQRRDLRDTLHISLFHKSDQSRIELGKFIERCWEVWHRPTAQARIERRGD